MLLILVFTLLAFPHGVASALSLDCGFFAIFKINTCKGYAEQMERAQNEAQYTPESFKDSKLQEGVDLCYKTVQCLADASCKTSDWEAECDRIKFVNITLKKCLRKINNNPQAIRDAFPCWDKLHEIGENKRNKQCLFTNERNNCFKNILTETCGENARFTTDLIQPILDRTFECN